MSWPSPRALTIATLRSRAKAKPAPTALADRGNRAASSTKPFFSLSTHRTYGTSDNARLWVDYQGVDHLDFRVYQVRDPRKFFTELKNPHQMGEHEEEEVASTVPHRKSFLETSAQFQALGLFRHQRRLCADSCSTIRARPSIKSFAKKRKSFARR